MTLTKTCSIISSYQESDDYEDEEEDMEVDNWALGNAEGTRTATPIGTRCPYRRPEASYATFTEQLSGSPQSIHTDTDADMEFDNLNVGTTRLDTRKVAPWEAPPREPVRELSTPDLVNCLTKGMVNATAELLEKFVRPLPVSDAADATYWERFQQRRATTSQPPVTKPAATGQVSAFDRLEHRKHSLQKEEQWMTHLEMTPRKVERGRQKGRSQEHSDRSTSRSEQQSSWSTSQKRQSQFHSHDEVDSKKGWTKGEGKSHKVQVRIDWANTRIQKPVLKPNP